MSPRIYTSSSGRGFPANAKGFLFPPVLWFLWFVMTYSVQGAGCEAGLDENLVRVILGILAVVAAAAIAVVGIWSFRAWERLRKQADDAGGSLLDQSLFLSYGALLHAGLFFVAVVWTGVPVLMAQVCNV